MGRSSRSEAEASRRRILEVASGLFRKHGIEAVGIAEVMKAAGMTQGGFYRHFASKDALAAEACAYAFARVAENWRGVIENAREEGRNPARALAEHYMAERLPERRCPIVALAADAATHAPGSLVADAYADGVRRLFEVFATTVPDESAAHGAFAGLIGAGMLERAVRGQAWIEAVRDAAVAMAGDAGGALAPG